MISSGQEGSKCEAEKRRIGETEQRRRVLRPGCGMDWLLSPRNPGRARPPCGTLRLDGRRIVIFSGGPAEADDALFSEVRAIRDGGGFGSIIDRNSFQRRKGDALRFLETVMRIYAGEAP